MDPRVVTVVHYKRAAITGFIGTGVLTALWLIEPSLGLPEIAVGHILGTFMSVSVAHLHVGTGGGWVVHFLFGVFLALIYARFFVSRLPGPHVVQGAIYGVLLFLMAQTIFMPLVGGGFFSRGNSAWLLGSLLGNLCYGIVMAWIYNLPEAPTPAMMPAPT